MRFWKWIMGLLRTCDECDNTELNDEFTYVCKKCGNTSSPMR